MFSRYRLQINRFMTVSRWSTTKHVSIKNGFWGVLDYVAQPVLMLLATPLILHRIGVAQYGLWMLASALVSGGSLVSSGFGDAAIKYVAVYRGRNDLQGVIRIMRGMLTINLILSALAAFALLNSISYAVHHIFKIDQSLETICIMSLRIGSLILVIKSIESIFVSTLRAFESYRPAVRIAIFTRIAILCGAITVVVTGGNVIGIMWTTLGVVVMGLFMQVLAVRSLLKCTVVWLPSWHRETLLMISGFGCFSWLQCLASVSFSQADRLIIGSLLGAPALGYYSICTQIAQPVHGLLASGLQVLFPYLSARWQTMPIASLKHTVSAAFWLNQVCVVLLSASLVLGGKYILTAWLGADFAQHVLPVLPIVVCSFALLGMNVTAYYTLLATGNVRQVTCLNLAAGAAMLLAMGALIPRFGIMGAAMGRLVYGPITWLTYITVYRMFWCTREMTDSRDSLLTEGKGA